MLDKRTLDTIRSQAEAGEFAHYGGMMVQDLLNHIDTLTTRLAERDATVAALEKRLAKYEGHLKKITITMQRDELTLEQEELRDELFMEMLEAFWTTADGSAWLDQLEAAKHTPGSDASEGGAE